MIEGRGRLKSIDALRGLAALGVVLYHATGAFSSADASRGSASPLAFLTFPFSFGYVGVYLFFVISGFCIHLQWVRLKLSHERPAINFFNFWKRRIRRLYPSYLLALAIFFMVEAMLGKLQMSRLLAWDVVSHLLMLHNFDSRTVYSLNGVFWTLAVEEQLYLAYFVLLALRVRFGWKKTLLCCLAARIGWFGLCFLAHRFWGVKMLVTEAAATQWLIWAMGAVGVEAAFGVIRLPSWCRNFWIGLSALVITALLSRVIGGGAQTGHLHDLWWLIEQPLWGVSFFILLNWVVSGEMRQTSTLVSSRAVALLAAVGLFSYSLYLTHELFTNNLAFFLAARYQLPPDAVLWLRLLVMFPLSIAFARLFFQFGEKPFLPAPRPMPTPVLQPPLGENNVAVEAAR